MNKKEKDELDRYFEWKKNKIFVQKQLPNGMLINVPIEITDEQAKEISDQFKGINKDEKRNKTKNRK